MTASYVVGDSLTVLRKMPDASVASCAVEVLVTHRGETE